MSTIAQLFAESCRLRLLRGLEELLAQCGFMRVAGVDEAGRGSLAGPVVAAAVIPDPDRVVPGVDDSKVLTARERERLAARVRAEAVAWGVAAVEADAIDRVNILEATRMAMGRAVAQLQPPPDCLLIDAVRLSGFPFPCLPLVRADCLSYAVASASILAKVERDRIMVQLDRTYPLYGFALHKGYGAPEHRQALATFGPSPVHRLTFHSVVPRVEERC